MSALIAGYEWRQRLEVVPAAGGSAPFPDGVTLTAQVRVKRTDSAPLVTLTTGNGGIVRISDTEIDLVVSGVQSIAWPAGEVILDLVRTDLDPDRHLGIALRVPVMLPVTRGL
jgi:hypothetical protein